MIKHILVVATGGAEDGAVFEAALQVARPVSAHLEFLHARLDVTEVMVSMASGGMGLGAAGVDQTSIDTMEAEAEALLTKAQQDVHAFCAANGVALGALAGDAGVTAEFTAEIGSVSRCIAVYGKFVDLVVVGGPHPGRDTAREAQEAALMEASRPTLIVPALLPKPLPGTVVIAWDDTPEALGAVSAAAPFLEQAERVVVLTAGDTPEDASDTDRLMRSLRWHNARITAERLVIDGDSAVATVLERARLLGAGMLVMGGYSHSRMREVLFGGFTQTILDGIELPVLIMH